MTQVVVTEQKASVVITDDSTAIVEPLSQTVALEVWQPGTPPGGKTDDLLVKASDQNHHSRWTDEPIVDKLRFDLTAGEDPNTGEFAWNPDEGTIALGKNGIDHYIGQDTVVMCRNASNTTPIPKGRGVMFAGTLGASGRLKVAPMIADGSVPGYLFFGVTAQEIPPAGDGYVATFGKIRGINTTIYAEEAILWCDPVNPGQFTITEPTAPSLKLAVAAVISFLNNGTIFVRWDTGRRLQDLHDVEANGGKSDKEVLNWNAATKRWEPTNRLTLLEDQAAGLNLPSVDNAQLVYSGGVIVAASYPSGSPYDYVSVFYSGGLLSQVDYRLGGASGETIATYVVGYSGATVTGITRTL